MLWEHVCCPLLAWFVNLPASSQPEEMTAGITGLVGVFTSVRQRLPEIPAFCLLVSVV